MNVLFEKVALEGRRKSCTELTVVNGKFIKKQQQFFFLSFFLKKKKKLFTIYIFFFFLKKKKTAVASNKGKNRSNK